jgi:tetratricopeptide (TPR) repeat protein
MPTNAKFYHSKGLAYQDTEEYGLAIEMFEKALDVSSDHIPSLYHLGLMQHKNKQLAEALSSLTQVLSAIGDDRLVYESRGIVYQDTKNHKKAIEDFNKAAEIEPTYSETYYLRGNSKVELGKI